MISNGIREPCIIQTSIRHGRTIAIRVRDHRGGVARQPPPRCAGARSPPARTHRADASAGGPGDRRPRRRPGRARSPPTSRSAGTTTSSRPRPARSSPSSSRSPRGPRRRRPRCLYVRASRAGARRRRQPRSRRRPPRPAKGRSCRRSKRFIRSRCSEQPVRIARGFSLPAGEYELTVVVREREREDDRGRRRLAAVLRRPLSVPDYLHRGALDQHDHAGRSPDGAAPSPRRRPRSANGPMSSATREIEPAADTVLRPSEELIVVFLVYNPAVTTDKHFDLEVEYHFFRKSRAGPEEPGRRRPPVSPRFRESGTSIAPSPSASIRRFWGRHSTRQSGSRCWRDRASRWQDFRRVNTGFLIASRIWCRAVAGTSGGVHGSAVMWSPACGACTASAINRVLQRRQLPWNA